MLPAAPSPSVPRTPDVPPGRGGEPGRVEHLTVAERAARGRTARAQVPRGDHAAWAPAADRVDPVELLEEQSATRVAELVPLRYGRMLASPFTFYRGAAYLMAADLATTPTTPLRTQLCGDAHLSNFGVYAAPDRQLVFDLNDFDETLPGPFEWDVKRLVTSVEVAGRDRGFRATERSAATLAAGQAYRETIRELSRMNTLDLWYLRLSTDDILAWLGPQASDKQVRLAERGIAKARAKTSLRAVEKLTEVVDGRLRIRHDPPQVVPVRELIGEADREVIIERVSHAFRLYRDTLNEDRRRLLQRFRVMDFARKVVGVGSVGTRAWIALLVGRDDQDPLVLQIKEANPSVLERFVGAGEHAEQGERVVQGQRLMQAASDILLGWVTVDGIDDVRRHYYFRQLWDAKGSARIDLMKPSALAAYARLCGWTLARAHARAGDAVAIGAYLGGGDRFERALVAFAAAYAEQNERDYAALLEAERSGRVTVQRESD